MSEGVGLCISHGWRRQRQARATSERTLGSQLHEVPRVDFNELDFALAPATGATARLGGLANGMDWQRIEAQLLRAGARAMVYVRTEDNDGVFSSDELHASAIFGKATSEAIVHVQGARDRYTSGYRIEEVPAIV